ncbi:hypothetical protein ACFCVU_04440 [Peribacillus butanolivorans]|uniref:hypothetical protein n=1 Tax=Peribacillus butanolivorans TaxID=421767 RepID=UPI0035D549E1
MIVGTVDVSFTENKLLAGEADKKAVDAAAKAEAAQTQATTALTSANGKNKNFYGSAEPTGQKTNDLWFKYNANGICVAIYRWNGTAWTNEVDQEKIQQSIDAAKKEAAAASSAADRKAAAAQAQADAALTKAQSGFDDAQTALANAATADSTAKKAVSDAAAVKVIADANTKNVSAVTQTANSLATRLTSAEGKVSTVTQTADGLQTAVFNKDGSSKITQLAGVVDLKISTADADAKFATQSQLTLTASSLTSKITQSINDLEIDGRNRVINSTFNDSLNNWSNKSTYWKILNPEDDKPDSHILNLKESGNAADVLRQTWSNEIEVNADGKTEFTISFDVKITSLADMDTNNNMFMIRLFDQKGLASQADSTFSKGVLKNDLIAGGIVDGKWMRYSLIVKPQTGKYIRVAPYLNRNGEVFWREVKLEVGKKTGWSPAPEDMATTSRITQLADDINLRVKKGDIVNQINVSTEGILIDGKKVHITGQTTIDDASISSAKIVSLLASKIVADSLSAISANLGTVTAGDIKGVNISGSTLKISNKPKYEDGTTFVQMKNGEIFVTDVNPDLSQRPNANDIHIEKGAIWMVGHNAAEVGIYELDLAPKYILFTELNANGTTKYQTNIRAEFLESPKVTTSDLTVNGKTALNGNVVINGQLIVPGIGSDVDMNNHNLKNVNHMTINDYGGNEGIEWLGGNGWKMFESPDDASNNPGAFQFFTGSTRRATIGATGNIYATGTRFHIQDTGGSFTSDGTTTLNSQVADSGSLSVGKDATGQRVWSMAVYDRTYSPAANLYITDAGTIGRTTSATKYKLEIKDSAVDPHKILNLNPKTWYDKAATEAYSDTLTAEQAGAIVDWDEVDIPGISRVPGLIAEDVIGSGLSEYAAYGPYQEDGTREVEGLMYDRLWTLLIPIVREHKEEIALLNETMKQQQITIENMAALMDSMKQRITALERLD